MKNKNNKRKSKEQVNNLLSRKLCTREKHTFQNGMDHEKKGFWCFNHYSSMSKLWFLLTRSFFNKGQCIDTVVHSLALLRWKLLRKMSNEYYALQIFQLPFSFFWDWMISISLLLEDFWLAGHLTGFKISKCFFSNFLMRYALWWLFVQLFWFEYIDDFFSTKW